MKHLFISYASADQAIALEVCALLEARGVSCWIAPRDVAPGSKWDEALLHAIDEAGAFLLLLSTASSDSPFVQNEVNRAFGKQKAIFTLRIEDVPPAGSLEFYLARHHWTDGFTGRLEDRVGELAQSVAAARDASTPSAAATSAATVKRVRVSRRWPRWITPAVAALAGAIVGAPAAWLVRPATDAPLYRSSLLPPDKVVWGNANPSTRFAISPDGRTLAFIAADAGSPTRLWIRSLETLTAHPLQGTGGVVNAFWSADSRRLAFSASGKLSTVSVDGGPATVIGSAGNTGGAWNRDNLILFEPDSTTLSKVGLSGGTPEAVLGLNKADAEGGQWQPFFLPDGKHFLYHLIVSRTHPSGAVMVASIDNPAERKLLIDVGSNAQYSRGYLLFMRGTTLMAQRFDADRLELQGAAVSLAEHIPIGGSTGRTAAFSVSQNGVLVYESSTVGAQYQLAWHDREGKTLAIVPDASDVGSVELSPDGNRIAGVASSPAPSARNVWLFDLKRGVRTQLTFDASLDRDPVWLPDGSGVVYATTPLAGNGLNTWSVKQLSINGLAEGVTLLGSTAGNLAISGLTSDGHAVRFTHRPAGADSLTLLQLPLAGEHKAVTVRPLSGLADLNIRYSPDGRWFAYAAIEAGQNQVFIAPVAGGPARWPVSQANLAFRPRWRRDGREIYFLETDALMAADVAEGPAGIEVGRPHRLFGIRARQNAAGYPYDVTADGQRFLVAEDIQEAAISPVTLVVNFDAQLNAAKK